MISGLPIKTICVSPLRRAIETAEIAAADLSCSIIVVEELRQCSGDEWLNMIDGKPCQFVHAFKKRVVEGLNKALCHPGPVLIVSHGGVHWALCDQINVIGHERMVENCATISFYNPLQTEWKAVHLTD